MALGLLSELWLGKWGEQRESGGQIESLLVAVAILILSGILRIGILRVRVLLVLLWLSLSLVRAVGLNRDLRLAVALGISHSGWLVGSWGGVCNWYVVSRLHRHTGRGLGAVLALIRRRRGTLKKRRTLPIGLTSLRRIAFVVAIIVCAVPLRRLSRVAPITGGRSVPAQWLVVAPRRGTSAPTSTL